MFKNLLVWQRSARLSAQMYKELAALKYFGFRDQLTRAGLSIASNIAEGYGRGGAVAELRQFLRYAKGSAAEVETQIYIGMPGWLQHGTRRCEIAHWGVSF